MTKNYRANFRVGLEYSCSSSSSSRSSSFIHWKLKYEYLFNECSIELMAMGYLKRRTYNIFFFDTQCELLQVAYYIIIFFGNSFHCKLLGLHYLNVVMLVMFVRSYWIYKDKPDTKYLQSKV